MAKVRKGHALQLEDGSFYIEEAPYTTAKIEDAEIYFKYFDLLEAQARAKRNTQQEATMFRVAFTIAIVPEDVGTN